MRYTRLFQCSFETVLKEEFYSAAEMEVERARIDALNSQNMGAVVAYSDEEYEARLVLTLGSDISLQAG